MNLAIENELLFDDLSILKNLIGKGNLINLSPSNDCDCTSNFTTTNQDNCDTYQIAQSISQTD